MGQTMLVDRDLGVPDRVHIVPMGFEIERVSKPLKQFNADKVVILSHTSNRDEFSEYLSEVKRRVQSLGVELTHKRCDIFDVYDSMGAISREIVGHDDDMVHVNISAGSKITAVAGMIACMSSTAVPYYAQATDYSGLAPSNVEKISSLPQFDIDPPTRDEIAILRHLDEEGSSTKKGLIEFGEEKELEFLSDFNGKEKARYRRLDRRVVSSLRQSGYIETYRDGRQMMVKITETGQKAYPAFSQLLGIEASSDSLQQDLASSAR